MDKVLHRWMRDEPETKFVGLTATLGRAPRQALHSPRQRREDGRPDEQGYYPLSDFRAVRTDLSGVRVVAGDFHESELAEAVNTRHLWATWLDEWLRRAKGLPTLAYGVDRKHASTSPSGWRGGIATEYIDANTPRDERSRFSAGSAAARRRLSRTSDACRRHRS